MDQSLKNRYCYVCGYDMSDDEQREVKYGVTCPCCVFLYGVDEINYGDNALMSYRDKWIEEGLPFENMLHPTFVKWNLKAALAQLDNLKRIKITDYYHRRLGEENGLWTPEYDANAIEVCWWKRRR
ncbi:hypothetical protein [Hymenobacter koreensis]|uniref:Uncharacterized protein n=1 Tax=Hymenobacter koreensis TaxID=1084523 RepID=A0ABP8JJ84_9BACT